jgi:hypothetical protein
MVRIDASTTLDEGELEKRLPKEKERKMGGDHMRSYRGDTVLAQFKLS